MVDCGELSLTNGRVFYSYYYGTATYSCNAGYDLIGTNTRTCLESGDWSGSVPTCSGKFLLSFCYCYGKRLVKCIVT